MEASEASEATEVVVGDPGLDLPLQEQEPISEADNHGSVTPSSAPPAVAQSGDPLDAATKAAIAGKPPAQGGPRP